MVNDKFLRFLVHFQKDSAIGEILLQEPHLDIHHRHQVVLGKCTEHNLFVDTVQEFWREHALDFFADGGFHTFVIVRLAHLRKAHAAAVANFTGAGVTRHDDYRILEVNLAAIAIRQNTIIQDLQKQVVNVRVSLFNFVQKYDRIRMLAHLFTQLSTAIFKAHVSRRSANQTAHAVLFHVFAHVDTDKRILTAKKFLAKDFRKFRLADTRRTEEQEATHRALVVADTRTATTDGLDNRIDRLILPNHALLDFVAQMQKLLSFFATQPADRNSRHLANHVANDVFIDNRRFRFFILDLFLAFGNAVLQFFFASAELGCRTIILIGNRFFFLLDALAEFVFHVLQVLRNLDGIETHTGTRFVENVNRLVRQEALADVTFAQFNCSTHGIRRVTHIVMLFILRAKTI